MGVPLRQALVVAKYLMAQKLRGKKRFPLVLMLEPLYRCNLECEGCGKIQHPEDILNTYLSPEECWEATDECGAPVVSIAKAMMVHNTILKTVRAFIPHHQRRVGFGSIACSINPL